MDKSWMQEPKFSKKYVEGVKSFMKFVEDHLGKECQIRCPCENCINVRIQSQNVVYDHLLLGHMMTSYTCWIYHGEHSNLMIHNNDDDGDDEAILDDNIEEDDGVRDILEDIQMGTFIHNGQGEDAYAHNSFDNLDEVDVEKFNRLLKHAQCELYPGCTKFSTLSFLIKLMHLKVYNHWSNKSFDMLLELLKEAFPEGETLPKSYYEAKNMLRNLGLGYVPIHACKYDCALFWKEFKDREYCPVCGTSRWKIIDGKGKKIPHKILRYFPIKQRLQRLFMSKKTAMDMRWHKEKRVDDENVLRHPADCKTWKEFDKQYNWFAQDPRNIKLGLATDGFNPFGNMSNTYSMWPVIIVPYNLPPWKCMKEPFFMMSLLIPGPQALGNDIDVYMRPLIDELKELWNDGVQTYDAYTRQIFRMHAAILWTINDFPAYANLSGWSTKGYKACPTCNDESSSYKLRSKICYMGHHRYLPSDHIWRKSKKFDGKPEHRPKPKELSGNDVLQQLDSLRDQFMSSQPGKHPNNRKRKRTPEELNWTRKSIFFELPYWEKLLLRHNLDVMHIEKNICDNILGTLLNIDGKTKDTYKARQDLEDMKIRKELHIQCKDSSYTIPPACYTMSRKEKQGFCEFLKSVKFLDGYASNIARCVSINDGKVSGLKSHDCHVLLQRLLPVGIRGYLCKDVYNTLSELGNFFQQLCCKTLKLHELEKLEKDIILILCKLEMIFPPAFFDVMVHLAVHLPREAMLAGPVQNRWMFPIER